MAATLLPLRREARSEAAVSDERLVELCASGNAAALDLLFRRHGDRVYRFFSRLPVVDRRALDDLVEATFVEAYGGASTYAGTTSVSVWLIGIAVAVLSRPQPGEGRRGPLPAQAATPLAGIARGMAALPEELQLAFVLCDLEEIRAADVAEMLGIARQELWRRVHYVRALLRDALPWAAGAGGGGET
jgi:DNA-directed RNA polymerase specialized sigma24 family protein